MRLSDSPFSSGALARLVTSTTVALDSRRWNNSIPPGMTCWCAQTKADTTIYVCTHEHGNYGTGLERFETDFLPFSLRSVPHVRIRVIAKAKSVYSFYYAYLPGLGVEEAEKVFNVASVMES